MSYLPASFLAPYLSTDKALVIKNTAGVRVFGFNVRNYVNSGTEESVLWILLTGEFKFELIFDTLSDAISAQTLLRVAIDTLFPNTNVQTPVIQPVAATSKTVSSFNSDRLSNNLIPYSYYEISDAANAFGLGIGVTFAVQILANNDSFVHGKNINTGELITLDFVTSKVFSRRDPVKGIVAEGFSSISTTGISAKLSAFNESTIIADTSTNIVAQNSSTINVTNSNHISATNGTNVTLIGANNIRLDGVVGDLSSLSLTNVAIDATSKGKESLETLNLTDGEILMSYEKGIYQIIPILIGNISKVLDDIIGLLMSGKVNSEFHLTVPLGGIGGYILTIKDSSNATIGTITDANQGQIIVFSYNPSTNKFIQERIIYTDKSGLSDLYVKVNPSSNGQTLFTNLLAFAPLNPSKSKLFLNTQLQVYNVDYSIAGKNITWISTDIDLETTDTLEIYYK